MRYVKRKPGKDKNQNKQNSSRLIPPLDRLNPIPEPQT